MYAIRSYYESILSHPLFAPEIDSNSISDLILLGPGRTPGYGVFKNINELEPASCGFFSKEGLKTYKYWELKDKKHTDSFEETVENVITSYSIHYTKLYDVVAWCNPVIQFCDGINRPKDGASNGGSACRG